MENNTNIIDFTSEGFTVIIEIDGVKTYASVNASMMPDEDGLDFTGEYFVYLLHPKHGSVHFTMDLDDNGVWKPVNAPEWIESEIIQSIGDAIDCNRL